MGGHLRAAWGPMWRHCSWWPEGCAGFSMVADAQWVLLKQWVEPPEGHSVPMHWLALALDSKLASVSLQAPVAPLTILLL